MTRYIFPTSRLLAGRGASIVLVMLFYFCLDVIYRLEIFPSNEYLGMKLHDLRLDELFVVILFSISPLFFLYKKIMGASSVIAWLLFSFSYLPTAFFGIYYFELISDYILLMLLLFAGLLCFRYSSAVRFNLRSKVKIDFYGVDSVLMYVILSGTVIYIWNLAGFNIDFDFTKVYERRLLTREIDTGLMAYLMVMTRTMFLVLGVYLWSINKNSVYFIISLFCVLGIFAFDGTKTSLILPVILIIYSLFIHNFSRASKEPSFFLVVFVFISILGLVEWLLGNTSVMSEYLIRRIFVVPGMINSFYFDYFTNLHGSSADHFLFGSFENIGQNLKITYLIGDEYFEKEGVNANSGIWMTSYAYLGGAGIVIVSIIAGIIAGMIDSLTKGGKERLGLLIGLMVGITWSEQALHTSILSGGILFYILLLFLINVSVRLNKNNTFWQHRF